MIVERERERERKIISTRLLIVKYEFDSLITIALLYVVIYDVLCLINELFTYLLTVVFIFILYFFNDDLIYLVNFVSLFPFLAITKFSLSLNIYIYIYEV